MWSLMSRYLGVSYCKCSATRGEDLAKQLLRISLTKVSSNCGTQFVIRQYDVETMPVFQPHRNACRYKMRLDELRACEEALYFLSSRGSIATGLSLTKVSSNRLNSRCRLGSRISIFHIITMQSFGLVSTITVPTAQRS